MMWRTKSNEPANPRLESRIQHRDPTQDASHTVAHQIYLSILQLDRLPQELYQSP